MPHDPEAHTVWPPAPTLGPPSPAPRSKLLTMSVVLALNVGAYLFYVGLYVAMRWHAHQPINWKGDALSSLQIFAIALAVQLVGRFIVQKQEPQAVQSRPKE